jgi:hypothetical protein
LLPPLVPTEVARNSNHPGIERREPIVGKGVDFRPGADESVLCDVAGSRLITEPPQCVIVYAFLVLEHKPIEGIAIVIIAGCPDKPLYIFFIH